MKCKEKIKLKEKYIFIDLNWNFLLIRNINREYNFHYLLLGEKWDWERVWECRKVIPSKKYYIMGWLDFVLEIRKVE